MEIIITPHDETEAVKAFQEEALKTRFAIETNQGFWNRETQAYHLAIENGTHWTFLDQADMLAEAMENIAESKNAWFKVITFIPFTPIFLDI